jgi:hypothetical protein
LFVAGQSARPNVSAIVDPDEGTAHSSPGLGASYFELGGEARVEQVVRVVQPAFADHPGPSSRHPQTNTFTVSLGLGTNLGTHLGVKVFAHVVPPMIATDYGSGTESKVPKMSALAPIRKVRSEGFQDSAVISDSRHLFPLPQASPGARLAPIFGEPSPHRIVRIV